MKYLKYIIVIVAMTIMSNTFAQTMPIIHPNEFTIELKDGVQRVDLGAEHGILLITIQRNSIINMQRTVNGSTISYNLAGTSPATKDCPCGLKCWEDDSLQQSICECKTCGGGGVGRPVLYLKYKL